ncbi:hypothetical protein CJJ07_003769 [Candidozyma auris]|nr:hypothetical protein CJJ07_003769 [[Candida] auris]QEL59591.1 hypothetical protein CJJ09_001672 [[Candida] auris]
MSIEDDPFFPTGPDSENGQCADPRQVFRIASNLKALIDKVIPTIFDEKEIARPHSAVLNSRVIDLVYRCAGGKGNGVAGTSSHKYRGALVFALLKVTDWYWQQAEYKLSDNELYSLRAVAAQVLAARIIENTKDDEFLFLGMLCHRYSMSINGEDSDPVSALELAVDMHSTIVIGSSGYQRCVKWLWRGWIMQSSSDPHSYVLYKGVASQSIRTHFDPDRIKTPAYQNIVEIGFSILYLILFTIILNAHQTTTTDIDVVEGLFYAFTLGSIIDEITKLYHVGWNYLGFWNAFNDVMYTIIVIAIGFRFSSLRHTGYYREKYDEISFRVLSCASPMMWSRLLLYLDAQQFVGAMIVVIKTMMKESILFFVLLGVVILGFVEGFLGLDNSDGRSEATKHILTALVNAVIGASGFEDVQNLVPPYASILYYIYSFLLQVILMNILIALYSTAYANIVENATDEYFALVAHKTLRYIRAPDTDLYVPPFNLIEWVIFPFSYIVSKSTYKSINRVVMTVVYSPILLYITIDELGNARRVQYNRYKGLPDDANEIDTEWDLTDGYDVDLLISDNGIESRDGEINDAVRQQRLAERKDPEFAADFPKLMKDIDSVVPPVDAANDKGIKWEHYPLYEKLETLTKLVEKLAEENHSLKQKSAEQSDT